MTYTANITDEFVVEVFKEGVIYDRVNCGDADNAKNFVETALRTYEENDIARANGSLLVEAFKTYITMKLKDLDWSNDEIDKLLKGFK